MEGISVDYRVALFLVIAVAVLGMIVQAKLQSVFNKYSKVMFPGGLTGREVAEKMLRDNGIRDVKVESVKGHLTDHFNPQNKTVNLSDDVYNSNSISAAAVAAHECGHAVQHATHYAPLKMRSALVPVVSFSSKWSTWVIILGIIIASSTGSLTLFWVGIGLMAMAALFALITLPVEYNASYRAIQWLESSRTLSPAQVAEAKIPLKWAARTYLVAALSAIATLLYYISLVAGRRSN